MLKAIFRAIVNALRAVGRAAGRIVAAPFAALGSIFEGEGRDFTPPQVQEYDADEYEPSSGPDMDAVYRELANIVMTWAAVSIMDGKPAPLPPPPKMPRALSEWLRGISLDEAHAIINATENEVFAHLRARELISGVRSVRPLEPAVWPAEFCRRLAGRQDVSYDACYALRR